MEIKFRGKPCNLLKEPIQLQQELDFIAVNLELNDFKLSDLKNKKKIISIAPSLDTEICALQTKVLNDKIKELQDISLITITLDLPFAQSRSCENYKDNDNHIIVSDYKYHDFANKTGLLIKELGLLARSIIVCDENNKIKYIDINEEISSEPNYEKLINFIENN